MSESPKTLTAALWAVNIGKPVNGIAGWASLVEEQVKHAAEQGCDLLLMPEYASKQWLSFAPKDVSHKTEVQWMADQAEAALEAISGLAQTSGIALHAGTYAVHADKELPEGAAPFFNRSVLFLPDGRRIEQDKLCLTPAEQEPDSWNLSSKLAERDLDVLMVPSDTGKLSGYSRVFDCAKARAVELQTAVLTVGLTGEVESPAGLHEQVSGASVYLPCEEPLGYTGLHSEVAASDTSEGAGPLLIARDIPIGVIRDLRENGAEVWPGGWKADHVEVKNL